MIKKLAVLDPSNDIAVFREAYKEIIKSLDLEIRMMNDEFLDILEKETASYSPFFYKKPLYKFNFRGFNKEMGPKAIPVYEFDNYGFILFTPEQMASRPHVVNITSCASYAINGEGRAGQNFYLSNPFWMNLIGYMDVNKKASIDNRSYTVSDAFTSAMRKACKDLPNPLFSTNMCIGTDQKGNLCVMISPRVYGNVTDFNKAIGRVIEYFIDRGIKAYFIGSGSLLLASIPYRPQISCINASGVSMPWRYHDIPLTVHSVSKDETDPLSICYEPYSGGEFKSYSKVEVPTAAKRMSKTPIIIASHPILDGSSKGARVINANTKNSEHRAIVCNECKLPIKEGKAILVDQGKDSIDIIDISLATLTSTARAMVEIASKTTPKTSRHLLCEKCFDQLSVPKKDNRAGITINVYDRQITEKLDPLEKYALVVPLAGAVANVKTTGVSRRSVLIPKKEFDAKNSDLRKTLGINTSKFYYRVIGLFEGTGVYKLVNPELLEPMKMVEGYRNNITLWAHRGLKIAHMLNKMGLASVHYVGLLSLDFKNKDGDMEEARIVTICTEGTSMPVPSDIVRYIGAPTNAKVTEVLKAIWTHAAEDSVISRTSLVQLFDTVLNRNEEKA